MPRLCAFDMVLLRENEADATEKEDPIMKIERLSQDKIRIFLTFDDLLERGIQKEDMWREIPKVHELFSEMMDQAYNELGFDAMDR